KRPHWDREWRFFPTPEKPGRPSKKERTVRVGRNGWLLAGAFSKGEILPEAVGGHDLPAEAFFQIGRTHIVEEQVVPVEAVGRDEHRPLALAALHGRGEVLSAQKAG